MSHLAWLVINACLKILAVQILIKFGLKKKKKMRVFDTLTAPTKNEILTHSIAFAKREINDNNLPTNIDVKALASDYVWQCGIIIEDYDQLEPNLTPAWGGPMPVKIPR